MTTSTSEITRAGAGLDAPIPRGEGRASIAYEVACTALILRYERGYSEPTWLAAARHASELHRISGALHRIDEAAANGGIACPMCNGNGQRDYDTGPARRDECDACDGWGHRHGRRLSRLRAEAQEIAAHYRLRAYHQTDPRGCALYLINPASIPKEIGDPYRYPSDREPSRAVLEERWIDANYNRGHAVVRLGR